MPILVRILLQRLFIALLSLLGFFGIVPDIAVNLESEGPLIIEEKEESITDILQIYEDEGKNKGTTYIPLPQVNVFEEIKRRNAERKQVTPLFTDRTPLVDIPIAPIKTKPIVPEIAFTLPTQKKNIGEDQLMSIPDETPTKTITFKPADEPQKQIIKQDSLIPSAPSQSDTSEKQSIENSIVNIMCVKRNGNVIRMTTGSGVIISPEGVILTNAHVAQYFLLGDAGYECEVHRENLPLYGFNAAPLYISEDWVENNFMLLTHPSPTGSGENDYALLYIESSTFPSIKKPDTFSYLKPSSGDIEVGASVTVAGYPGRRSGSFDLDTLIPFQTDTVRVQNVYSFGRTSTDLITTSETHVGKQGASGGGVIKDNRLVGIIATTNPSPTAGEQYINAITISYISSALKKETGLTLSEYTTGNFAARARNFRSSVAPPLEELLLRNL